LATLVNCAATACQTLANQGYQDGERDDTTDPDHRSENVNEH
jgi:hypothetical protein